MPAPPLAFVEPLTRCAVATLTVAPTAGSELVLDPARASLDARHEVLGRGRHESYPERPPAPHTGRPVAFEHDPGLYYPGAPEGYFMRVVFRGPAPKGSVTYDVAFNAA